MDFFSGLSDNQAALVMCVGALFGCGLLMSLSYYIGAGRRRDEASTLRVSTGEAAERDDRRKAA